MSPALYLGGFGFGLIAVCYGFARFAFGLFLPQIDATLSLSSTLSGLISGGSFLGYCVAILLSAYLTERAGPRFVALLAALVAAFGMVGIAFANSPWWLAAAVMLAGSSTGLASPPMAAAVAAIVERHRQSATNTVINAGTGAGVVLSGPVALLMGEQWRLAFAGFAAIAFAFALLTFFCVPASANRSRDAARLPPLTGALKRLIAASFLLGAASTAVWSFGGQLVALSLDWGSFGAGLLWIAIGAAGMAGAAAGSLVERFGINRVHRVFLAALVAGTLMVGMVNTTPMLALLGGALFGVAYITVTGVYLVWGVKALSHRPATGLMVGFLTIAIGQTAGAPVFGLLMDQFSATVAVASFAALAAVAGLARA
ncbi:MFS transporter [Vreelandella malpeensis]|uniref:MFS transporter n=1 Tax=Vreelandella malpeensis TaxID=1172368 RepID=A0ABS8DTH5_9GAMM|nr:MFS transporter [Halomonas malpeensis]MCB8889348.1 MFS transporter [Halomonas malpeensis]